MSDRMREHITGVDEDVLPAGPRIEWFHVLIVGSVIQLVNVIPIWFAYFVLAGGDRSELKQILEPAIHTFVTSIPKWALGPVMMLFFLWVVLSVFLVPVALWGDRKELERRGIEPPMFWGASIISWKYPFVGVYFLWQHWRLRGVEG